MFEELFRFAGIVSDKWGIFGLLFLVQSAAIVYVIYRNFKENYKTNKDGDVKIMTLKLEDLQKRLVSFEVTMMEHFQEDKEMAVKLEAIAIDQENLRASNDKEHGHIFNQLTELGKSTSSNYDHLKKEMAESRKDVSEIKNILLNWRLSKDS